MTHHGLGLNIKIEESWSQVEVQRHRREGKPSLWRAPEGTLYERPFKKYQLGKGEWNPRKVLVLCTTGPKVLLCREIKQTLIRKST